MSEPHSPSPTDSAGGAESAASPDSTASPDPRTLERWRRSTTSFVRHPVERPVLLTLLLGVVFVVVQTWWIHRARFVGGFDVDEAGGIANALLFHRLVFTGAHALVQGVGGLGNGPMVPLLAVPFLVVGPRAATTAMIVQPALVAAAAVGAAGTTRRIAGNGAAAVAGVAVLCMPAMIVSSRSFQNSTGVAAFLALAMWALMASDRARRTLPMLAFGAAVGAMLLSRTMSAGFLPAVGIAALVIMARERRAIMNIAASAAAAIVVAGPWWYKQWDYISSYLAENAYGDRAEYWGNTEFRLRLASHVANLFANFSLAFPLVPGLVVTLSTLSVWTWRREHGSIRTWPGWSRELSAVWIVWIGGYVALMSTSNLGFWFSTPLDVMLIVGLVSVAVRSGATMPSLTSARAIAVVLGAIVILIGLTIDPRAGAWTSVAFVLIATAVVVANPARWPRTLSGVVVGFGLVTTLVSLPPVGGGGAKGEDTSWRHRIVNDLDLLQGGNLDADIRLGSSDLSDRKRAAAEWQASATQLVEELMKIDDQLGKEAAFVETTVGSMHLFNSNTIGIAEELYPRGGRNLLTVNTLEPSDSEIATSLTPMVDTRARVLVVIEGRSLAFPDDRGWPRLVRLATDMGWHQRAAVPLPDGGKVVVYTHPDSIPDA